MPIPFANRLPAWNRWTFVLLILGCLIDPSGRATGLKYFAFLLFSGTSLLQLLGGQVARPTRSHIALVFFCAVVVPVYCLGLTVVRTGAISLDGDLMLITSGAFLCASLFITGRERVDFALNAFDTATRVLAVMAVAATISEVAGVSLPGVFYQQIKGNLVVASRDYGGCAVPYIYIVTSPMLVFGLARAWFSYFATRSRSQFGWALLFVLALLLSGTRGNMVIAILGPVALWVWYRRGFVTSMVVLAMLLAGLWGALRGLSAGDNTGRPEDASFVPQPGRATLSMACTNQDPTAPLQGMVDKDEPSNSIKIGYLKAYKILFADTTTLLFGQGLNARGWSETTRSMLPPNSHITELIYPEMVRIMGLPMTCALLAVLAWPCLQWRRLPSSWRYCAAGWGLYLVLSASNPYIFSSNGMLLLALVLASHASREAAEHLSRARP